MKHIHLFTFLANTTVSLSAADIHIDNFSFVDPSIPVGPAQQQYTISAPPSWIFPQQVSTVGVANPINSQFTGSSVRYDGVLPSPAEGFTFGYLNLPQAGNSASMTYTGSVLGNFSTLGSGASYKLTIAVGARKDVTTSTLYTIELLRDGNAVASNSTTITATPDSFQELSVSFNNDDSAGAIGIRITANHTGSTSFEQAVFDNVRLVGTPTVGSPVNFTIENYSFLDPSIPVNLDNDTYTNANPPGWTAAPSPGQAAGIINPDNDLFSNSSGGTNDGPLPGTAEGTTYVFMNIPQNGFTSMLYSGASLGNFSDHNNGSTFALTVAIGRSREGDSPTYLIELLNDNQPVASATGSATSDTFVDLTASFALSGQTGAIGIRISTTSNNGIFEQAAIDNVRLSVTPGNNSADSDGDNYSDALEALFGTSSSDPSAFPKTNQTLNANGSISLTWPFITGVNYAVEASENLVNWTELSLQMGNGSYTVPSPAPDPSPEKRFFRIRPIP